MNALVRRSDKDKYGFESLFSLLKSHLNSPSIKLAKILKIKFEGKGEMTMQRK